MDVSGHGRRRGVGIGGGETKKASEDAHEITIKPNRNRPKTKLADEAVFSLNSEGQAVQGVRSSAREQEKSKKTGFSLFFAPFLNDFHIFSSLSSTVFTFSF